MLENSIEFGSRFSHSPAQDMADFIRTINMGSQIFAIDATATDVQTSATTILAQINGVSFVMPKDDALDVSADLQLNIWVTGSSYTAYHMRYVVNPSSGLKQYYKCILAHTSSALNKPDENNLRDDATWKTYWTRSNQTAEAAVGQEIPTLHSANYLCLATKDGTLTLVKAGPVALDADVELVIPSFEPEMFVAIGTLLVNAGVGGHTLGDDTLATVGTFAQLIGPVFPTGAGIKDN